MKQTPYFPLTRQLLLGGLVSLGSLALAVPALAHHPFGGDTPTNALQAFLSGVGHPVIGLDHLAFVIAAGLLAAIFNRGLFIPVAFVVTSLVGTLMHLGNIHLPAPEMVIAASVLLFGVILALKKTLPSGVIIALAAGAGLFHGYAYGEAIVGAGMPSLLAYLVGFSAIQTAIAVGAYLFAKQIGATGEVKPLTLRCLGLILTGMGIALTATVLG
jgi:urease accessory protein